MYKEWFKLPKTTEFLYEIGDYLKDNILVTDRFRDFISNRLLKAYKYKCLVCNNENIIREDTVKKSKYICNVCANRKVIKGVNDIAATHPEYIKYFVDINDAYTHSFGMAKKVLTKYRNQRL